MPTRTAPIAGGWPGGQGRDFPGQRIGPEPTTDRFTAVMEWLEANIPDERGVCVIHNDFRFDNVVLDPKDPTTVPNLKKLKKPLRPTRFMVPTIFST